MSVTDWLSILGALTGIAGAVMGFVAFRRSGKFKAIDLRLSLRKAHDTLQADAAALTELLQRAKKSRERMAAATGTFHSGATKGWLTTWETDLAGASQLQADVAAQRNDYLKLSHTGLESELVSAHVLQRKVNALRDKYNHSMSQDEVRGEQLRQDNRLLTQAKLDKGK